jgi:hypothetical protein
MQAAECRFMALSGHPLARQTRPDEPPKRKLDPRARALLGRGNCVEARGQGASTRDADSCKPANLKLPRRSIYHLGVPNAPRKIGVLPACELRAVGVGSFQQERR